jgi:ubiquinone/menaquinone biosynthesis C-methylase UbiE
VLEIGCGRGVAMPVFRDLLKPALLLGLDIDCALLERAAERIRGDDVSVLCADARCIPLPDASIDLAIDFGTCYHIGDPAAALREVARVLRPGGVFVHETPVSQLLAHPLRSFGRTLPWRDVPALRRQRTAVLWSTREKRRSSTETTRRHPDRRRHVGDRSRLPGFPHPPR